MPAVTGDALTAETLAAMEARAAAATAGPWAESYVQGERCILTGTVPPLAVPWCHGDALTHENADFIAHARDDVPALLAEVRRLTAALDGVRREERARCIAWLRAHDATTTAREAAVELQQCAWGVELLTEPVEADDATAKESAFMLTIDGKPVTMTVAEVTRTTNGRREVFWSTRVGTKAAGLRSYDHWHSGSSRMEAVGWTLQVLAGEGMEPTAMAWTATGSAT